MKWSLPIVSVWLLVGLIVNAQVASSVVETYTGGNLNAWLYLTSFTQDKDILAMGAVTPSAMIVMALKYILMVLIVLSALYTVGKNLHLAILYGIKGFLTPKNNKKETVE